MLTVVHASDLHLGLDPYGREERYLDYFRGLEAVVDAALARRADLVLLSGDLFDQKNVRPRTLAHTTRILKRLRSAGIPVFAIHGNHDRFIQEDRVTWLAYLSKEGLLHHLEPARDAGTGQLRFAPWDEAERAGTLYEGDRYRVIGLGYPGGGIARDLEDAAAEMGRLAAAGTDASKPTFVLLHAGLDGGLGPIDGGVTATDLERLRPHVRYLGLGHLHRRVERDGWVFGPGCLEATSIDEHAQDRGFFVATVPLEGGAPIAVRRVPFAGRPVVRRRLDLEAETPLEEVGPRLEALLDEATELERARFKGSIFEVAVSGRVAFDRLDLDVARLRRILLQKTGALVAVVTLDLVEEALVLEAGLGRDALERRVFERLVRAGDYRRCEAEVVDLALRLIPRLEQGAPPEELAAAVSGLREMLEARGALPQGRGGRLQRRSVSSPQGQRES